MLPGLAGKVPAYLRSAGGLVMDEVPPGNLSRHQSTFFCLPFPPKRIYLMCHKSPGGFSEKLLTNFLPPGTKGSISYTA